MEFKRRFLSGLKKEFSKVWDGERIAQNLAILKELTKKYNNYSCAQWRPTGKGPLEQTNNYRIRILTKKISYFKRQLVFQERQLKEVSPEIANGRRLITGMASRRNNIISRIENNQRQFGLLHRHISKINLEALIALK